MTDAERNNLIKAEMGKSGEFKRSLARKLNLSRPTLDKKLNGNSAWTIKELECLAKIYGKDRTYFF